MKGSRQGFTLVELLLTLGVLAIGLVSIFTMLPRVSQLSRELRDEDRMRDFAEAVFASMEWQLQSGPDAAGSLSDEEKRTLPVVFGSQPVVISDVEQSWPDTASVEDLVTRLFYTLQVQTNAVSAVEVLLQVRPESRNQARSFNRTFYPQVQAW